ncbi:hypothetical protein B0T24DRAFT_699699 [Lasiosphaeria ovina]|uniref:Uncharacterized protein n=1 Tax=Lasiosphaeria ovina TaxID=92902 RepID=A0AAE0NAJ3_9PEZI|nr:hypothetical protein B0T24DRAFT_699699 [Lasiosphaeria ovina]
MLSLASTLTLLCGVSTALIGSVRAQTDSTGTAAASKAQHSAPTPGLTYLYSLNCSLGAGIPVGTGPVGIRTVIPITGGVFSGPRLSSKILDLGADWSVVDGKGAFRADTRYQLRTDDGADIFVRTAGPAQADGRIHLTVRLETGSAAY